MLFAHALLSLHLGAAPADAVEVAYAALREIAAESAREMPAASGLRLGMKPDEARAAIQKLSTGCSDLDDGLTCETAAFTLALHFRAGALDRVLYRIAANDSEGKAAVDAVEQRGNLLVTRLTRDLGKPSKLRRRKARMLGDPEDRTALAWKRECSTLELRLVEKESKDFERELILEVRDPGAPTVFSPPLRPEP